MEAKVEGWQKGEGRLIDVMHGGDGRKHEVGRQARASAGSRAAHEATVAGALKRGGRR